jgi:hypothetical protein
MLLYVACSHAVQLAHTPGGIAVFFVITRAFTSLLSASVLQLSATDRAEHGDGFTLITFMRSCTQELMSNPKSLLRTFFSTASSNASYSTAWLAQ